MQNSLRDNMILTNKNILCDLYYKFKLIKIFSHDFNYILNFGLIKNI